MPRTNFSAQKPMPGSGSMPRVLNRVGVTRAVAQGLSFPHHLAGTQGMAHSQLAMPKLAGSQKGRTQGPKGTPLKGSQIGWMVFVGVIPF